VLIEVWNGPLQLGLGALHLDEENREDRLLRVVYLMTYEPGHLGRVLDDLL
jgi:hypothetical protein